HAPRQARTQPGGREGRRVPREGRRPEDAADGERRRPVWLRRRQIALPLPGGRGQGEGNLERRQRCAGRQVPRARNDVELHCRRGGRDDRRGFFVCADHRGGPPRRRGGGAGADVARRGPRPCPHPPPSPPHPPPPTPPPPPPP